VVHAHGSLVAGERQEGTACAIALTGWTRQ